MPVVDASVLVEYVGGGERRGTARAFLEAEGTLWAPHLIDAEVGHVLRRSFLANEMNGDAVRLALTELSVLPVRRAPHTGLIERAWALRDNLSFYDALYVALAEVLDQPLLTFDARIARASGVRAVIEVLD